MTDPKMANPEPLTDLEETVLDDLENEFSNAQSLDEVATNRGWPTAVSDQMGVNGQVTSGRGFLESRDGAGKNTSDVKSPLRTSPEPAESRADRLPDHSDLLQLLREQQSKHEKRVAHQQSVHEALILSLFEKRWQQCEDHMINSVAQVIENGFRRTTSVQPAVVKTKSKEQGNKVPAIGRGDAEDSKMGSNAIGGEQRPSESRPDEEPRVLIAKVPTGKLVLENSKSKSDDSDQPVRQTEIKNVGFRDHNSVVSAKSQGENEKMQGVSPQPSPSGLTGSSPGRADGVSVVNNSNSNTKPSHAHSWHKNTFANASQRIKVSEMQTKMKCYTTALGRTFTRATTMMSNAFGNEQTTDSMTFVRNSFQYRARKMVYNRMFEMFLAFLIMFNAASLGASADWDIKHDQNLEAKPGVFRGLELFFVVMFSIELALRVTAEGCYFFHLRNKSARWNWFDTILVVSAVFEEIFQALVQTSPNLGAVRLVRILRLMRIVRVFRVMRFFRDLRLMVYGIMSSLKSLCWCLLLLMLIMYIFSVFMIQVATMTMQESGKSLDEYQEEEADPAGIPGGLTWIFASLSHMIFTLFMAIAGGIDWGEVAIPLMDMNPVLAFIMSIYVAFAVFCVLNIVTGVFVENSSKMAVRDEEHMILEELNARQDWFNDVRKKFQEADVDGEGALDWEKFSNHVSDVRVQAYFNSIGLDVTSAGARGLFSLLDFNGDGKVDMDEFVLGCSQLRGQARSLDIARLRHDNKSMKDQIAKIHKFCRQEFEQLRQMNTPIEQRPYDEFGGWRQTAVVRQTAFAPQPNEIDWSPEASVVEQGVVKVPSRVCSPSSVAVPKDSPQTLEVPGQKQDASEDDHRIFRPMSNQGSR